MTNPNIRARTAGRLEQRAQLRGTQEVRKFSAIVAGGHITRSTSTPGGIEITGSPIVYNAPYQVFDSLGSFEETMLPGVVSQLLGTCDCRFLVNHGAGGTIPLARTSSGTLVLRDGSDALRFTANLDPRQSLANDLAVALERKDVTQMSCAFVVGTDSWSKDYSKRTISGFSELLDVSAVTYPASPTTSIGLTQDGSYSTLADSSRRRQSNVDLYAAKALALALRGGPVDRDRQLRILNEAGRSGPAPLSLYQARLRALQIRNEAGRY